jgi:beta-glucosidase
MAEFSGNYTKEADDRSTLPRLMLNAAEIHTMEHGYSISSTVRCQSSEIRPEHTALTYNDVKVGLISINTLVEDLSVKELATLCVGNVWEEKRATAKAEVMTTGSIAGSPSHGEEINPIVPGASETTTSLLRTRKIPKLNLADGGSGIRLISEFEVDSEGAMVTPGILSVRGMDRIAGKKPGEKLHVDSTLYYQYATAYPMATLLAQSWNPALIAKCGHAISLEAVTFGVDIWLGPSMNIHRNPLCGRNFEYYSEDPLITGVCGSTMVNAVQEHGRVSATIKHLACNNQEDNRDASNAHVSERALREIYLRGFEIAIREAKPMAMMTALNLINGHHCANCADLLISFARNECGYKGLVMTDWGATSASEEEKKKYTCSSIAGCIETGNDLIMPGRIEDVEGLIKAEADDPCFLSKLRAAAENILGVMLYLDQSMRKKPVGFKTAI